MRSKLILISALLSMVLPASASQDVVLFSDGDLSLWEPAVSDEIEPTAYSVVEDSEVDSKVLEANANNSASGYLTQQPLPFSPQAQIKVTYKLLEAVNPENEKTREGDDFPLRIYLTARSFPIYRTIVLVHALQVETGAKWTSPYSGTIARFEMYAFASGENNFNEWLTATIPVGELWDQAFGTEESELTGFGFMVDSDNSGGNMRTRIANIEYSY